MTEQANIIQILEPDGSIRYECGWHHLPMPDNFCPKCQSYPSYEAMRADLPADNQ